MIQIAMDSSCFSIHNISGGQLLDMLKGMQDTGDLRIYTCSFVISEVERIPGQEKRDHILNWINTNTSCVDTTARLNPSWSEEKKIEEVRKARGYGQKEFEEVMRIHRDMFPTALGKKLYSHYLDYRILMTAILEKHDYFVHSNPRDFENNHTKIKEKIEERFPIKIRTLDDDFLQELVTLINKTN